MKSLIAAAVLGLVSSVAFAQMTPVGLWRTIDDETKQPKAQVRISESGGVITGKIEKLFDASKQDSVCDLCTDDRKGQKVIGLTMIRNVKQDADDKTVWGGGEILDAGKGKAYKTRLKPIEGGKKMEVRGYIGFFYRTQVWERVE
jgi:uncharacterized protein (DUF2147 family)